MCSLTGVGKALAVKDAFKKKFEREKYKRELKKRQNDYNATGEMYLYILSY